MVYAMASIIKSQPRIVQAMTDLPEDQRFTSSGVWFAVRSFFETDTVQYVTAAKKTKKFPVVNIPNTMPGFDILWFCLCTKDEDRTMDNLKIRPTFTQISLKADVQTIAKEGYEFYWTKIVKGSRNPDNKGGRRGAGHEGGVLPDVRGGLLQVDQLDEGQHHDRVEAGGDGRDVLQGGGRGLLEELRQKYIDVRMGEDKLTWEWVGEMVMKLKLWETSLVVENMKMKLERIKDEKVFLNEEEKLNLSYAELKVTKEESNMIMDQTVDEVMNCIMPHIRFENKLIMLGINLKQL